MKKFASILLSLMLFYACAVTKQQNAIIGQFKGRTPGMGCFVPSAEVKLFLNSDSAFNLHWIGVDYTGQWNFVGKNNVLLHFDEIKDPILHIRSGVILQKERTIRVINKNKINMEGYCILKRIR